MEYHFQGTLAPLRDEFFTLLTFKHSKVVFWFIHSEPSEPHLDLPRTPSTNLYDSFSESSIKGPLTMNVLNMGDRSK